LCACTTALGLLSMAVSAIHPVRVLALAGSAGVMLAFVQSYLLLPQLLEMFTGKAMHVKRRSERKPRIPHWAVPVILYALASIAVCFPLKHLRVSSSPMEFFPSDDPIIESYREIEENVFGLTPFGIVLESDQSADGKTVDEIAEDTMLWLEQSDQNYTARIMEVDSLPANQLLIQGQTSTFDTPIPAQVEKELREVTQGNVHVVGPIVRIVRMRFALIETLMRGMGLMLACVTVIFLFLFRRPRLFFAAILANFLPLWILFGAMVALRFPIDVSTVLVLTITLGMAVDDTFHFLFHFQRESEQNNKGRDGSAHGTALHALQQVRRPVTDSSLVTASGFAMLAFTDFTPIRHFGILLSLGVILALLADLYLLPSLLASWDSRQKENRA